MPSLEQMNAKRTLVFFYVIVFQASLALSGSMYGNLLPSIISEYKLSLTQASLINISGEIGNLGAMLVAMFLLDRTNKNKSIGLMVLLYSVAMFLTGRTPVFGILLLLRIAIGASGALVDNLCASYTADLYGDSRARYVSFLHVFFAVGSVLGPPLAAYFLMGQGWNEAYIFAGLLMGGAALVYLVTMFFIKGSQLDLGNAQENKLRKIPFRKIIANKNIQWLGISSALMASAFYINIWTPTYLQMLDPVTYTVAFCSLLLTLSYVGMIMSRALFGVLVKRLSPARYLEWSSLISAILIFLLINLGNKYFWIVGMLLFGIANGAQYTAKFLLAFQESPEFTSTVGGLITTFSAIGGIVLNYAIGYLAEMTSYTMAMYVPALIMFLVFLVFRFVYDKPRQKP